MTIKVDETTLLTFLLDWQAWAGNAKARSPAGVRYSKRNGLCSSVFEYIWTVYDKHSFDDRADAERTLRSLMQERFRADGFDGAFPFGQARFYDDCGYGTMHLCPLRLQWVDDTIAVLTKPAQTLEQAVQEALSDAEFDAAPMPTWFWTTVLTILVVIVVSAVAAWPAKAETQAYPRLTVSSCSSIEPASEIDNAIECNTKVYSLMAYDMDFCYMLEKSIKGQNASLETECEFIH